MAIAERTKSVIDETLYEVIDEIEEATGGNQSERPNVIPTKPAHWATVWDTLGYTDTGFIGDYMATDLAVTGMDDEIFLNHSVLDRSWNAYLQENHINGTRAIIKTAMAYALTQREEFNPGNVVVDPVGRAGYVFNPDTVTDTDEDGPGTLPGPEADGIGDDGEPVEQRPYEATNMRWFDDSQRADGATTRSCACCPPTSPPTRPRSTWSTRWCWPTWRCRPTPRVARSTRTPTTATSGRGWSAAATWC